MAKNILVIGSGGREHALCWRLKQSPQAGEIYCTPGNGGIAQDAQCVTLGSPQEIIAFCRNQRINLVMIGPEQPLVEGLADTLRGAGIPVFGPGAKAARLEGSKSFTKEICAKYDIPTAAYGKFEQVDAAKNYIRNHGTPIVVKADGLAAGKGVTVAMTEAEALAAVEEALGGKFGAAGSAVVIEEFMEGEEVSFFALSDGSRAVEFGHAQDHKRAYDGDLGPNTGGMGAYSPAPAMTPALRARVMREIIEPTVAAMRTEGCPFQGVLFAGLMLTAQGPKLLEYNARFGDPETQVLMMRMESDLIELLLACAEGSLPAEPPRFREEAALCVVMAANGYPGTYEKGTEILGLEQAGTLPHTKIFHAGTERRDGRIFAAGGRVLGVTALGGNFAEAQRRAYLAVDLIDWPGGFCRRDIGRRAIETFKVASS